MLYMVSQSTGDGVAAISVVFKPGTNIDQAQVLVQNRVSVALPRLPEEVQRVGVTVRKSSPDLMLVIHLISPDGSAGPAIHFQLRDHQHQGRHHPHRRRRRHDRVRRPRLFHADLARPRQGAGARPHRQRRGGGPARRQRAGGGRRHQPAAGDVARRVRDRGADARPAVEPGAVRRDRGRHRSGRPRHARARHRAGSSSARRTTRRTPISTTRSRPRSASSSGRARTRSPPPPPCSARWRSSPRAFPPGSAIGSPTTPPSSSSNRSTR